MSGGPVPSNLVLLSQVKDCAPGTKVRFLGCIDDYLVETATLRLKHNHPPSNPPQVVNLSIEHALERIKRHETDVGTWLNVIGYVEQRKEEHVYVQAVAVWDAGNVDLEAYQRAVEMRNSNN